MAERLKKIWHNKSGKGKDAMLILILIGGLLAVLAIPVRKEKESETISQEDVFLQTQNGIQEEYETKLEERLENILRQVEGVGEVEVMITLESSAKAVVEKDISMQQTYDYVADSEVANSDTDKEENTVYTDSKDGSIPYVVQEIYPQVQGVLVVAEGGDDSYVNIAIVEAIQALFDVDVHKIKIVKMNT